MTSTKTRALAVRETPEFKALAMRAATALRITPIDAARAIAKYGTDIVEVALEIKEDDLKVAFYSIVRLVKSGLTPVEAKVIYLTRACVDEKSRSYKLKHSVSLRQLARLVNRFEDFKESGEDDQYEIIEYILSIFGWQHSFPYAVNCIIARADYLGFDNLADLLSANEEVFRGDTQQDDAPEYDNCDGEDY